MQSAWQSEEGSGWQYCGVTMPRAPVSTQPPGRRAWPALGVVLAVLLLHAALLGLLPQTVGGPSTGVASPVSRPLQVRQLVLPAVLPAPEGAAEAVDGAEPTSPPPPPSRPPAARSAREPEPRPPVPDPAAPSDVPQATAADGDTLSGTAGQAAPAALPAGTPVPTYATRLPPPATLQYTVQRGGPGALAAAGALPLREGLQAQLIWRPDIAAASYTLSLGLGAVGSASVGALDLHGIAPERHVETRRGREVRAANFQRQAGEGGGRISFSGPRIEHPLWPGVQDRLSWMLQLAGVLAADPGLGQPGREVSLLVVGVRGDAAPWTFRVMALQTLQLPAGEVVGAVHLLREAQRPFDTRVDVWLDPARHHLPVRLRLQTRADGPGTEFELLRLEL
jgi:Protein of unknown function (DUF3108)